MESTVVIQIVVSAVVILGAAGVALLCDFLKGKNEQLREAMVELQVRREEEAIRVTSPRRATAHATSIVAQSGPVMERKAAPAARPVAEPVAEEAPVAVPVMERATAPVAKVLVEQPASRVRAHRANRFQDNGNDIDGLVRKSNSGTRAPKQEPQAAPVTMRDAAAELTSLRGRREEPAPVVTESLPKTEEMNSKEALADWLSRRAAARAKQAAQNSPAAAQPEPQPATPVVTEATPVKVAAPVVPAPVVATPVAAPVVEQKLTSLDSFGLPPVEIDAFLWESLLSGKPAAKAPVEAPVAETKRAAAPSPQFELIRGTAANSTTLMVPAGMHDQTMLARLMDINKPFTGLVVSIGVNENDGRATRSEEMKRSTADYITSLLRESDFGAHIAEDEYLLISPGETGAEAQRRLSNISERLWDYQLRGIGTFSILFSSGGVDVTNESLADAVNAATDRMNQTKRSRKTVSMDSVNQRRKAV